MFFAPFDAVLSHTDVVQPDLLFVRADRSAIVTDWVRGVPDLVIEVLSPSNRRHDELRKRDLYERFGVSEYWILDLEVEMVKVYRLADGRYGRPELLTSHEGDALRSPLLPGFELPLARIFR